MRKFSIIPLSIISIFLLITSFSVFYKNIKNKERISALQNQIVALQNERVLEKLLNKVNYMFNIPTRGIIHVGASDGQEAELYNKYNVKYLLWIEADPDVAARLSKKIGNNQNIKVASFAAADRNGVSQFMRTNNQQSSSLMDFGSHTILHPGVLPTEKIEVKLQKLDDFLVNDRNSKHYNALVLDTQGAELLVLKGAVKTLDQIDYIEAEIEYDELYKGGTLIWELDTFLLNHGFVRADTISETRGWGDALYIKKKFLEIKK